MAPEPTAESVTDPSTGLTSEDLRHAALTVCARATDVDEARSLLEALGLLESLRAEAVAS